MVGIIGYGRFGKFLAEHMDAKVCDVDCGNLKEVCCEDVIIISVPISKFEIVLKQIKPLIKEQLVVDTCSVKEEPIRLMKEILPESCSILGTHPLFGPDSADSTEKKIAICRVRINDELYDKAKILLIEKGLKVIECTPEEHDRSAAKSQVITQFIGRALMEIGSGPLEIDTEGYRRLMKILGVVKNDTYQLFKDMNFYNRFSVAERKRLIESMIKIDKGL
ncbi:prephenate dehydrogenase/arogenate dehydrogenase family protein [Candidatus Woesearchaeota archaeon]|nr:prephenate dehydrogenase/arogenate dehydrogenase family protein [Candidatus Woesearchaeota archaeon]